MCVANIMGKKPEQPVLTTPAPPPPPSPPPSPTTQGVTVGSSRRSDPLQDFLKTAITASKRRGTNALRTDVGGTGGGTGLNVPTY